GVQTCALPIFGHSPSRAFLNFSGDPVHDEMLQRSIPNPFEDTYRKPTWQPGILSKEISTGARLELPGREYVLFAAGPRTFADPDWVRAAPWRDIDRTSTRLNYSHVKIS